MLVAGRGDAKTRSIRAPARYGRDMGRYGRDYGRDVWPTTASCRRHVGRSGPEVAGRQPGDSREMAHVQILEFQPNSVIYAQSSAPIRRTRGRSCAPGTAAGPAPSAPSCRPRWLWLRRPRLHRPSARRSVSVKRTRGRSGAPGTAAGPAPSAPSQSRRRHPFAQSALTLALRTFCARRRRHRTSSTSAERRYGTTTSAARAQTPRLTRACTSRRSALRQTARR